MIYAKIGHVSEGSRLTRDLIENFSYDLKRLAEANLKTAPAEEMFDRHLRVVDDADKLLEKEDWATVEGDGEAQGMIDELEQALEQYAPPYVRFGEVPGERDCWGFYADIDSLNDDAHGRDASVLKIDASDPWPADAYERAAKRAGWNVDVWEGGDFSRDGYVPVKPDGTPADGTPLTYEWEAWHRACELAKVKPELKEGLEFVAEITDHGNVTLFSRDGVELWSCV